MVYTIEGKWKYEEHDWVSGPGSIVFETAASTHTFEVVAEGESGYVLTLVQVNGDLLFLDDKDNIVALENWKTSLQPLSCLLRAARHRAERPHGIQLIIDITNGTTP